METTRSVTLVAPQTDKEKNGEEDDDPGYTRELLQVYAPMYTALIDPPYELPPQYMPAVVALQLELFTLLMDTFTPLAVVTADSLLLVFVPEVQAYPPRYTENDPPYTCAKTLHQRASYAQQQYDRGGDDRKNTDIGTR